jgi:preprotein translocase subunit SecB
LETERNIDLVAVGRIARRVELKDIRLTELAASAAERVKGSLEAELSHECSAKRPEPELLEINCDYKFAVRCNEALAASVSFTYTILYLIAGDEAIAEQDLSDFAFANGTYHSWPFVRQLLYDITSKMGYPPYTLPVFRFNPKPPVKPAADTNSETGKPVPSNPGVKVQPS